MIYGVNDAKIILLKFVFIEAVLIPAFPGTEIVSIITFPILRIVLFSSILELIKFSTMENLIKIDAGITGNYTTLGSYTYSFPKSYKQVLGVAINIYKTGTATTLENVYLSGFNNAGFTFVKDCVDNSKANTVKIAYTVFYI